MNSFFGPQWVQNKRPWEKGPILNVCNTVEQSDTLRLGQKFKLHKLSNMIADILRDYSVEVFLDKTTLKVIQYSIFK